MSVYLPCKLAPALGGAAWVRSQSRMTATSNQETWRADIAGVVVFDVLRQVPKALLLVHSWTPSCGLFLLMMAMLQNPLHNMHSSVAV